ncbi:hypothetical protein PAXRUDRAFT_128521 [Paxillus rubicundulus Ve08.2h10]|uniref:Methyltransferase domain-containing protein n=1 Tax=Paxillus rubicundulus Ve08.2h10 TaxID=930991 RepID=A0A0D0EDG0_9AGAM|nr:hypothetical protein PAXRUDRAFT_128521 [Paxillus rubicundulus Ve08.2h10]
MGKDAPTNKPSKGRPSNHAPDPDVRRLLTPSNGAIDGTQDSPKREGALRNLLKRKKKPPGTPLPTDIDPFTIGLPSLHAGDARSSFQPAESQTSFRRSDGRDHPPVEVFEPRNHFVARRGMKHHPYSRDEAPYMQAYDRTLIDSDRFSEILLQRLNRNQTPSFHDFGQHTPQTILDLGCGAGEWAVQAAQCWPSSQVIGFDLVDPTTLRGGAASPSNVQWKRGNFVKYKLPFPKNMFDLVRMANLALCIPHDRWEHVLSEARRVLAQGGRLELIDDYLYFPYSKNPPQPSSRSHISPPSRPSSSSFDVDDDDDDEPAVEADDDEADGDESDEDFVSTKSRFSTLVEMDDPPQSVYDPVSEWKQNVDNSKSLEQLFEDMLSCKFSVHSHPSKFIDNALDNIFGRHNQSKLHEFNLYLAPPSGKDSDESSIGSSESSGSTGLKKAGMEFAKWVSTVEWDHNKDKDKKQRTKDRSSSESIANPLTIPEIISAKAAGRLGIAGALPRPSLSTQSPGLILWPSTFIPIAPFELEMHACKHLHSLVGCKAALTEYVQEQHLPLDQCTMDDLMWDYESFRRKRFNWPSECPEFQLDMPVSDTTLTPRSTSFRPSHDAPAPGRPRGSSDSSMTIPSEPLFPRDKLDLIRSIRVYSAIKIEEETHVP